MIAQRLAIAAIVATWSVPTVVVAQHAKAEPTAAHGTASSAAPAKESADEHASSPSKKDVHAEPVPHKSPAKEASTDAGKRAAKPTSEHAAAKSDGKNKDKDTVARRVEEAKAPAHASAERASSEKEAEPATSGGKKVASTASARSKTSPKNELEAALKRIDEQIATMRTSPAAAQPAKPRAASETRPERVSPTPSVARINLSWRTTLVWEPELEGREEAARDARHVGLVWPIEPLESTPLAPTSTR